MFSGRSSTRGDNWPRTNPLKEPLFWLVTGDQQWALSGFTITNAAGSIGSIACLYPFDEAKKRRGLSPATWVFRQPIPPGRLQLPPRPDDGSGYFRLYNTYLQGYLGEWNWFTAWHRWIEHVPENTEGGYLDVYNRPAHDVNHDSHDDVFRVKIWPDSKADLASCVNSNTGLFNKAAETAQQQTFKSRAWLVQPVSPIPTRKAFTALQDDYIKDWQSNHEASLKPTPP